MKPDDLESSAADKRAQAMKRVAAYCPPGLREVFAYAIDGIPNQRIDRVIEFLTKIGEMNRSDGSGNNSERRPIRGII